MTPKEIKAVRNKVKMSRRQFAGALGMSEITIYQWERGERIPTGGTEKYLSVLRHYPQLIDIGKHGLVDPKAILLRKA